MNKGSEPDRKPLLFDPFHSDDSRDLAVLRIRNHAATTHSIRTNLLATSKGGQADHVGYFSYLFPDLVADPTKILPTAANGEMLPGIKTGLGDLAASMNAVSANSAIPAGMTYLGQFIDHDITFDPMSTLGALNDPNAVRNFRTPGMNLDNLYGGGPDLTPYLYDGAKLRIGGATAGRDLPRAIKTGTVVGDQPSIAKALIGDPRNDENIVVAQLHAAFIAFHNKVVDIVLNEGLTGEAVFPEAVRRVRWHYQWIVVNHFLPSILQTSVLDEVNSDGGDYYTPGVNSITMPVEFSMAAYRFGHSLVREGYRYNNNFPNSTLEQLFQFTGSVIPPSWEKAEWKAFFKYANPAPANAALKIDSKITNFMHQVPTPHGPVSVPKNNLLRGYSFSLPTGQAVANELGAQVLTPTEISHVNSSELPVFATHPVFKHRTPLWYYILKEAEVQENGERLGTVGSRIVAEVFLGLLRADRTSYFNAPTGMWTPTLPALANGTSAGDFRIEDLIAYAGHSAPDGTPT